MHRAPANITLWTCLYTLSSFTWGKGNCTEVSEVILASSHCNRGELGCLSLAKTAALCSFFFSHFAASVYVRLDTGLTELLKKMRGTHLQLSHGKIMPENAKNKQPYQLYCQDQHCNIPLPKAMQYFLTTKVAEVCPQMCVLSFGTEKQNWSLQGRDCSFSVEAFCCRRKMNPSW